MKIYIMRNLFTKGEIGVIQNDCLCITNGAFKGMYSLKTVTDKYGEVVTGFLFGNDECFDHFQEKEEFFFQYLYDADKNISYKCWYKIPDKGIDKINLRNPMCILEYNAPWFCMEEMEGKENV